MTIMSVCTGRATWTSPFLLETSSWKRTRSSFHPRAFTSFTARPRSMCTASRMTAETHCVTPSSGNLLQSLPTVKRICSVGSSPSASPTQKRNRRTRTTYKTSSTLGPSFGFIRGTNCQRTQVTFHTSCQRAPKPSLGCFNCEGFRTAEDFFAEKVTC